MKKVSLFLSMYWQILFALILLVAACCYNIFCCHGNAAWFLAVLSGVVVFLTAFIGFCKYLYPYDFLSYAIINMACVMFAITLFGGTFDTNIQYFGLGIFVSFIIIEILWYIDDHESYGINNVHIIAALFPALMSFIVCSIIYAALVQ